MTQSSLALVSKARMALEQAKTIDDVKDLRDKAEAVRQYAKQAGESLEVQNAAAEVKLRAERKAGEMLAEMEKHNGDPRLQGATRLSDLGIEKTQSHRWQRAASVPADEFEHYIADALDGGRELTSSGLLKLAKKIVASEVRGTPVILPTDSAVVPTLDELPESHFVTVYADPPWRYGNQATRASTDNHYPTMTVDEICEMNVGRVVADNAHLHLWTTNAFLFEAKRVIEAWGFEYRSCFVWVKPQMGIGNYWRVSHEFLLFGLRGKCPFRDNSIPSWLSYDRTAHSAKPAEIRKLIERVSPGPFLEMFGRVPVSGWTTLGNQVEECLPGTY